MVRALTIEQTQVIYRAAIDAHATDAEGEAWWQEVREEVAQVISARTVREAAANIEWWHNDWTVLGDSARAAAKRLRDAAKNLNRL